MKKKKTTRSKVASRATHAATSEGFYTRNDKKHFLIGLIGITNGALLVWHASNLGHDFAGNPDPSFGFMLLAGITSAAVSIGAIILLAIYRVAFRLSGRPHLSLVAGLLAVLAAGLATLAVIL